MRLSFILPVYNESATLREFFLEVRAAAQNLAEEREFIFINDGSRDGSLAVMKSLRTEVGPGEIFRILDFSRNFGQQAAVTAGVEHATGDAIILMDTDMQDDPAAFAEFVRVWKAGHDVVYAVRSSRRESVVMRFLFRSFYRILGSLSNVEIPMDAGNFGLISRRVADEIRGLPEHNRYFPGLRAWVGFPRAGVDVPRRSRGDGPSRLGFSGLFRLAVDGLLAFSDAPLRLAFLAAFILSFLAVAGVVVIVGIKLFTDKAVVMWASIMCSVLFIGAMQFFLIGLLGEYIGRIYSEVKRRPHYIVREVL
ncbi:MAG: glycosyltransferase family 2 protein [Planctomycetota bacterium]